MKCHVPRLGHTQRGVGAESSTRAPAAPQTPQPRTGRANLQLAEANSLQVFTDMPGHLAGCRSFRHRRMAIWQRIKVDAQLAPRISTGARPRVRGSRSPWRLNPRLGRTRLVSGKGLCSQARLALAAGRSRLFAPCLGGNRCPWPKESPAGAARRQSSGKPSRCRSLRCWG